MTNNEELLKDLRRQVKTHQMSGDTESAKEIQQCIDEIEAQNEQD